MTDATPTPSSRKDDLVGQFLDGRYRVERLLGRGGMGSVYLAHDERVKRKVVVKVPHERFLEEEGFRERFEREIESLTQLPHPHIVKVMDVGSLARKSGDGTVPFAILEYLSGGSLKDRLVAAGGKLAPVEVAEWLRPVAQALDFIHGEDVVHRDVKPGNVLFDAKGHVFLADFGIAKALGAADTGLTQTGMTPGSPDYMAPEGGMGSTIGPAYDQYALGVVVYEALAGRLPHKADTPVAILLKKHTEPVPPLATFAPHVPPRTVATVMRALDKDPAKRFASCEAFAQAFTDGLSASDAGPVARSSTEPTSATRRAPALPPAAGTAASKPPARRPSRRGPILVGLLLAAAGVVALIATKSPGPSSETGSPTADPPTAALSVSIDSPADGALLASRGVRVTGRVRGPAATTLKVNGVTAVRTGDQFEVALIVPSDGSTVIEAVATSRGLADASASMRVDVDATPPKLVIVKPVFTQVAIEPAETFVAIVGQVTDANLVDVRIDGKVMTILSPNDRFEADVALSEGQQKSIHVVATDKAGHRDEVTIDARRKAAPPPAPVPAVVAYANDVADATSKALGGDWDGAKAAWAKAVAKGAKPGDAPRALLDGIKSYEAEPVFDVAEPVDGATVPEAPLRVRGTLSSGRATDEVIVNGTSVRTGPGAFDVTIPLSGAGRVRITVGIRDRGSDRGTSVTRTVTYAKEEPSSAAVAFLSGWATAVGTEKDSTTGYPKRVRRTKDGATMVLIPAGTFQMGAVPSDWSASSDEKPRHSVTLSKAYYMDETEVTVGMWKKYVSDGGGTLPSGLRSEATDSHPIHNVSWDDIQGYLSWSKAQLPTEAQWERAAMGGHDDFVYPWGASDDEKKRNGSGRGDGFDGLSPTKSFAANDYGLYDMSGNVREWCADGYESDYYAKSPSRDPAGPASASSRVVRGGSFGIDDRYLRAFSRWLDTPSYRYYFGGFRCSRSLPGEAPSLETPTAEPVRIPADSPAVVAFLTGWAVTDGAGIDESTGYPKRIRRTRDGATMVLVPAGTFQMGAVPSDSNTEPDEKPRHAVTLSKAYYMDETEVTVGMWKKYVSDSGGTLPSGLRSEATDAHPIHNVSLDDIQGYLAWSKTQLPTEAQWERAAKGGHDDFVYPWGASDDEKKRNGDGSGDGFDGLSPVKSFLANDYGLYDMLGNVCEWCADWYVSDYYGTVPGRDPSGPASASSRVVRGGSFGSVDRILRASDRLSVTPAHRGDALGFRCSRSLPTSERSFATPSAATPGIPAQPMTVAAFLSGWAVVDGAGIDESTGYPKRIRRTKDGATMVLIPAGTFQMGAVPSDSNASSDEKPRHAVTLSKAYYLDETEVTVGMWKKYVSDGGRTLPSGLLSAATDAHPIHIESWDDLQGYLAWSKASLPTEAQWERAAKGGHDDNVYPWGASDDGKKRNGDGSGDGFDGLSPVKSFSANDYGLYDMSGNVWEWCADRYESDYYGKSPSRDPSGPSSASSRVVRGGSFF